MDFKQKATITQINLYKQEILDNKKDISLTKIMNSKKCQSIMMDCREYRDRIYTPFKTLIIFIKQVLHSDKSCKNALGCAIAECLSIGRSCMSSNTGPYCKARSRLPEESIKLLVKETGGSAVEKTPEPWKWHGRDVKIVDGTTVIMADTKENQIAYPQHSEQGKGLGFPIARLVVLMSLSMGVVLDYDLDAYKGKGTGEHALFRSIFDSVHCGDILLGDSYYPSFFLMCDLVQKNCDGVFEAHGGRNIDFRKGESLGKKEHIVEWEKPKKPEWMNQEAYETYPGKLAVREFKVNGKVYVTTIMNHKKHNKWELSALYQLRWQVEINLKSIKTTMNMHMLSCKSPAMVRKEIGVHFIGYNVIRIMIAEACGRYGVNINPNQISFKATVQLLNHFMSIFLGSNNFVYQDFLMQIICNKIGNRPGRVEPRAVKKRPKSFPRLQIARDVAKKRLLCKLEKRILRNAAA